MTLLAISLLVIHKVCNIGFYSIRQRSKVVGGVFLAAILSVAQAQMCYPDVKSAYTAYQTHKKPVVDINRADVMQLSTLDGVGVVLARRIVAYRQTYGKFADVEALKQVSGIGDKIIQKNRVRLRAD